jgi:hypothetical protein
MFLTVVFLYTSFNFKKFQRKNCANANIQFAGEKIESCFGIVFFELNHSASECKKTTTFIPNGVLLNIGLKLHIRNHSDTSYSNSDTRSYSTREALHDRTEGRSENIGRRVVMWWA